MNVGPLGDVALLIVATGLLWKGADWVVHSASRIANRFGLSDVVIGMTVVALGTSAPEVVVTLVAAFSGQHDISVGNVVGSNIFNVGFILGGCAAVWGIPTTRRLVGRDGAALLCASLLLWLFLLDNHLDRWEGLLMMALLCVYVTYLLRRTSDHDELEINGVDCGAATKGDAALLVLGLVGVIGGAYLLVYAAVRLAAAAGLSEWAIGVTIVAGGTSLPELATSVAAAARGRPGIVAGNLIGSDLDNVLGVLGLAAFLKPLEVDPTSGSLAMMCAMLLVLVVFMRSGWRLSRPEGVILICAAILRWGRDLAPALLP